MKHNSRGDAPPPCARLAIYAAMDGSKVRVPIPTGVTPQGMMSLHGLTRVLLAEIDANDPRTDDEICDAEIAIRSASGEDMGWLPFATRSRDGLAAAAGDTC